MNAKKTTKTSKRRKGVPAYTRRELVMDIASQTDLTQIKVKEVVQKALDILADVLAAGHAVEFRDFGVLSPVTRKARVGRDPKHPETTVPIPERTTIKFKVGAKLKSTLLAK